MSLLTAGNKDDRRRKSLVCCSVILFQLFAGRTSFEPPEVYAAKRNGSSGASFVSCREGYANDTGRAFS